MKVSSDLILDPWQSDHFAFNNGYAKWADYRIVATLQMTQKAYAGSDPDSADPLLDHKSEHFDFVVGQFDTARSTDSSLIAWSLSHAQAGFHLGGSDAETLGGDLAYCHGRDGSLEGPSHNQVEDEPRAAEPGLPAQLIKPHSGNAGGSVSLL
jgi:hypothetical protein